MTAVKHAEQDARLDKLDATDREFLAIAATLVSEHKQMQAQLADLRKMTQANGVAIAKVRRRVDDLEMEGEE